MSAVQRVGNAITFWDDLSIDGPTLYNIAVQLAKRIEMGTNLEYLRINFFMPRFREHLKKVYGINIPQHSLFDRASLFECYVQCDGKVFPSQKYSEMNLDILAGGERLGISFHKNSLREHTFQSIWDGEEFDRYRELMTSLNFMKHYDVCQTCKFAKTYCIPNAGAAHRGEKYPQLICAHLESLKQETRSVAA
jgi:hypothetical protein